MMNDKKKNKIIISILIILLLAMAVTIFYLGKTIFLSKDVEGQFSISTTNHQTNIQQIKNETTNHIIYTELFEEYMLQEDIFYLEEILKMKQKNLYYHN